MNPHFDLPLLSQGSLPSMQAGDGPGHPYRPPPTPRAAPHPGPGLSASTAAAGTSQTVAGSACAPKVLIAGDCMLDVDLEDAVRAANRAAGVVVEKFGTASVTLEEMGMAA